jgi:hypothetical protein
MNSKRTAASVATATMALIVALTVSGFASDEASDHEVIGRYSVESDAGGGVWTFQPGGLLVVIGPGDIISEGTWEPALGEREFDASVEVTVSGQTLDVLGQVSPGSDRIAIYVTATEPTRPDDADLWPTESRLVGERFGMVVDPSPSPEPTPEDCARPEWVEDAVDWDRCSVALLTQT